MLSRRSSPRRVRVYIAETILPRQSPRFQSLPPPVAGDVGSAHSCGLRRALVAHVRRERHVLTSVVGLAHQSDQGKGRFGAMFDLDRRELWSNMA